MLCKKPFVKQPVGVSKVMAYVDKDARQAVTPFGCGQCLPCRINRSRVWQTRLLLENMVSEKSCFVSLTYNDEHLPMNGMLVKKDLQKFIKRLRYYSDEKIRYLGVGEYGEQNGRPHYHICLFGVGLEDEIVIKNSWKEGMEEIGIIDIGEINRESARYIVGYVIKELLGKASDKGVPEFMICSRNPGIGASAIDQIAEKIKWKRKAVIRSIKYGKATLPLGRYLVNRLTEKLGMNNLKEMEYENYQKEIIEENYIDGEVYLDSIIDNMKRDIIKVEGKHNKFKRRRKL